MIQVRVPRCIGRILPAMAMLSALSLLFLITGCGVSGFTGEPIETAPTVSVSSTPATIVAGGAATLTVTAVNATQVVVSGTDGTSYTMPATGGTQVVSPGSTVTYTANATGTGGKASSSTTVTVTASSVPPPKPTVTINANPTSISSGNTSTLTIAAANATKVTVSGTDGSSYTLQSNGGTQIVSPTATTTYTATATGSGSTAVATALLTVTPATGPPPVPSVAISANPTTILAGASSTLTVTAGNATKVTVAGNDGSTYTLSATGGTQSVNPAATTTYTATATGPGGTVTATAVLTVTPATGPPPAPTVTIAANPTTIAAGASSTLTVTATNATQVTIAGSDGTTYTLQAAGGTQAVSPTVTTTYTATATGAGGQASVATTVTVTPNVGPPPAPTTAIAANPASITTGSQSTLMVTAANATQLTVTGTDGSSYTLPATGGTQTVSPGATTTYTSTATGPGGSATAATTVTVVPVIVPPTQPTVSIAANPGSIVSGASSTLSVTATNATTVTIAGSDGTSYALQANGGTQAVSPTKTTTYTATASGAGGTAMAATTVTVAPPAAPTVSISANPMSIVSGNSSTLTITATNAATVTVTGTDGNTYTLAANGGTQVVKPTTSTTYTANASGPGGQISASVTLTVTAPPGPTVTIVASPTSIVSGNSSTLTVTATNSTGVTVTGSDQTTYNLGATGGTQDVSPTSTTTYTAAATGAGGNASATAIVTVTPPGTVQSINHVIFMLQENHTFDNYLGMLNPYRKAKGWNIGDDGKDYEIDGIDDKLMTSNPDDAGTAYPLFKLKSTCIDDDSSDWLASYGDVNRYDFTTTRKIQMNGFVHNAEGFATSCNASGTCSGSFTDLNGQRAMGYYDQGFLNYYYYMASQFAVSNRWFSPISSKSISNRIATFTGGTTQGLVLDPTNEDHVGQLPATTIFQKLDQANVTWKIYYTATTGLCLADEECQGYGDPNYPATDFSELSYSYNYLRENPSKSPSACTGVLQPSSVVGDTTNSFCIDPAHIEPLSYYYSDLANGTLPSFSFIEAGYGNNDEHPGSGQSVLYGQAQVANVVNSFMTSPAWKDSVFFLGYDEGGGPFEHVPPVPGHSNDNTDASLGTIPDIASIAVNPDGYPPCVPTSGVPITNCDLTTSDPGAHATDAAAVHGFAAQLGFRIPNMIISPFTRKHYVGNIPMDHTAVIRFVEDRFIGNSKYLTNRDAAQPNLLDFFDFNNIPWATPPTPPAPVTAGSLGTNPCQPSNMGP